MMRYFEAAGRRCLIEVGLQAGPTRKAILASDGKLGVAELHFGAEDLFIARMEEARMELAEALRGTGIALPTYFQQIFGLMSEVVEAGVGWKASYRHANFLSYAQIRIARAEREFEKLNCECKVDFCPIRGSDAPSALGKRVSREFAGVPAK